MSGAATRVLRGRDRLGAVRMMQSPRPVEVITLGCRLNIAESEAMRVLAGRRLRRSGHRQQLRGDQRGGAPDPPGDPRARNARGPSAGGRDRLRGADRARALRGDARGARVLGNARKCQRASYRAITAASPRCRTSWRCAETAPHLRRLRRARARLRRGAERLRPSLHLLRHPLGPRQQPLGADRRGGRRDRGSRWSTRRSARSC